MLSPAGTWIARRMGVAIAGILIAHHAWRLGGLTWPATEAPDPWQLGAGTAVALAGCATTLRALAIATALIYVIAFVVEGWRRVKGESHLPILLLAGAALLAWAVFSGMGMVAAGPEAVAGKRLSALGPWSNMAVGGFAICCLLIHGLFVLIWPVEMVEIHRRNHQADEPRG
jgi:hypothetical protein